MENFIRVPLNLPQTRVLEVRQTERGEWLIRVESTQKGTLYRHCGREITEVHGYDEPIRLRHLPHADAPVATEPEACSRSRRLILTPLPEPFPHSLPDSPQHGYTIGMKTAVSLPDDLFRAAEQYARRVRKSRSQLYADALSEYLARHAPDEVTEAMNRVLAELGDAGAEPFVARAARRVLEDIEW
jgi:predicted transcriptional regulator